jgi:putative sterol carrier protein
MNERFEALTQEPPPAFLADGWEGTYLIDAGSERSRFRVHEGKFEPLPPDGPADCTVICSSEDLPAILDGSLNLLAALLRGRVQARGDLNLGQRLHAYIRAQNYLAKERASA